jgi:hypothetical protein
MRITWVLVLAAAIIAVAPMVSAQKTVAGKSNPTVDNVLDHPERYVGQEVTLEGEIDHIYSPTTFAMEDDQDLIGDDQILMISVMPVATRSTTTTKNGNESTTTTVSVSRDMTAIPAVEVVRLVERKFDEGKIVSATGMIRMFDRAALEQEFGTIDFGSAPLDKFKGEPVLVIGARQYAELKQQPEPEQVAAVVKEETTITQPVPEPEVVVPAPAPEPAPIPEAAPEAAPEPQPQEPAAVEPAQEESLPRTASPIPAVGLTGLLSLLVGLGIRVFRSNP